MSTQSTAAERGADTLNHPGTFPLIFSDRYLLVEGIDWPL